jgi:hypothetical protein
MKLIPVEIGPCISEHYILAFRRERLPKKRCLVKTLTGFSEREMYKIYVRYKKPMTVFCDTVTGSLFNWQGKCLSSTQRRIVRWL